MDLKKNIPTNFVVFGITGDLAAKKIIPALFHLFKKGLLSDMFKVIGYSHTDLNRSDFEQRIIKIVEPHISNDGERTQVKDFIDLFIYQKGSFENKNDYLSLVDILKKIDDSWGVCSNKLFYLAVSPKLYEDIFSHLSTSKLTKPCSAEEGWTRVIVEKPFGENQKTARRLEMLMGKLFKEVQIYRIDHYLAKEMLQNILMFRFSNNLFENNWNNNVIESINIQVLENIGVEERGVFYDHVGALRDVGQNHLLQMLALATMEYPESYKGESIRSKRGEVLQTLKPLSIAEIKTFSYRAQYNGYRKIKGVQENSQTETYFKIRGFFDNPRWVGVPFTLESGKRLGEAEKKITITFGHPMPCLCPTGPENYKNQIIFNLEPKENITIKFWAKKPGLTGEMEQRELEFDLRGKEDKRQYIEEYEKLLLDCIAVDQTLFLSTKELQAMWNFVDPIMKAWEKNIVPLKYYEPDSKAITALASFIDTKNAALTGKENKKIFLTKEIGVVGLGKMGANMCRHLLERGWKVVGYNRSEEETKKLSKFGLIPAYSLKDLVNNLSKSKIVWLMIPSGKAIDEIIFGKDGLVKLLAKGDTIIDGGNSFYEDSARRVKKLKKFGINFVDVGFSGGPGGARDGASLMVGGEKKIFETLEELFRNLSIPGGYGYFGKAGAGHFVKMIHNGIEYGMMQSLAEGFEILKKSNYKFNLKEIAEIYNHGSVIESRLVNWLINALQKSGNNLKGVKGDVDYTGEGEWTVKTAKRLKVPARIIEESFKFRVRSKKKPSFSGQVLSALRQEFGGHGYKKGK